MFSIVILTLNEEKALPDCLASTRFSNDVVVLDSGSTDRTVDLAKQAGARVITRPFDTFAGQRNYAQQEIEFRNPWVFHLDADERLTPPVVAECSSLTSRLDLDGFRLAPQMMFKGRWIRHCTDYPAYQARFVRVPGFRFIQVGHGQREAPQMRMENLRSSYLHDLSIYGIDSWIEKHKRYAKGEARALAQDRGTPFLGKLFSKDPIMRRRAVKRLSFELPFRPALRFLYQYCLRGGFLDGPQGLEYCRLLAKYESFIAREINLIQGS